MKAIKGRRAPTSTPPARSSSFVGPKSGASSPPSIRRCSSSGPPARKNAGPRPAAELAVEEDRQAELVPDPLRQSQRRLARPLQVLRDERDERDDVGGPDPRMRAVVARAGRSARARTRSLPAAPRQLVLGADEREDRAVVVLVGVHVEQRAPAIASASASASIVARSRPSEKFGTDSSGRATCVV